MRSDEFEELQRLFHAGNKGYMCRGSHTQHIVVTAQRIVWSCGVVGLMADVELSQLKEHRFLHQHRFRFFVLDDGGLCGELCSGLACSSSTSTSASSSSSSLRLTWLSVGSTPQSSTSFSAAEEQTISAGAKNKMRATQNRKYDDKFDSETKKMADKMKSEKNTIIQAPEASFWLISLIVHVATAPHHAFGDASSEPAISLFHKTAMEKHQDIGSETVLVSALHRFFHP